MDNERLEDIRTEINRSDGDYWSFDTNDIAWLISTVEEQAEQVKDLKIMLKALGTINNRYHEALELILKNSVHGHVRNIAKKALEGESNGD